MSRSVHSFETYVPRVIDGELDRLFGALPAVLLDGPKGVGKTATAARRCVTVRRLDEAAVAQVVGADPSIVGSDPMPVLLDEWHRVPTVWDAVRRLVDDRPDAARILLTGSAPLVGTHSGAGRITTLRLRPLCFAERLATDTTVSIGSLMRREQPVIGGRSDVGLSDYVDEIIESGFPAIRKLPERARTTALDGYLERIVDHDLREAGFAARRPAAMRAWLRAYAAATATTASWEQIRDSATAGVDTKPAKTTTAVYGELLTQMHILDPLDAWLPGRNHFTRLAASPKHHLADPALAVRLLKRTKTHLLRGDANGLTRRGDGTLLGNLFESLAALTVRTAAQAAGAHAAHLRTRNGDHEIDFILEGDEGIVALEVKLSSSVEDRDVRHLHWLRERLGGDLIDAAVITTGSEAYRRSDGIAVVPLALLGA